MEKKSLKKQEDLEKHIGGCMAGFFNIFDRPHLLSPKRLSTSPSAESERSSPLISKDSVYSTPELRSPAPDDNLKRSPLTLPVMEFKQGSSSPWRFSKEAPRLSLDSRAVVDAKGSLKARQIRAEAEAERGSPSVIARLMGLEALPSADPQQPLQRSASESRVSREYRFMDSFNFQNPQLRDEKCSAGGEDPAVRSARAQPARAPPLGVVRRKSFFDSGDIFPEPRQCPGMEAPPTDLETLKQLLEALRLKGLLHSSNKQQSRIGNRNLVFDNYQVKPSGIRSGAGVSPSRRDRGSKFRSRTTENSVKSPIRIPTLKAEWRRPEPVHTGIEDECSIEEEMWKVHDFNRQGKTLLERCDKLLHSIAEMAAAEAGESQPSPVSVLDVSLYHEDSSPSPVMKRTLDFAELEDESWGGSISSNSDSEFVYISDILRASDCLPQESDIFSLLEKQQYLKGRAAAQERRLIFDAVQEIVGRRRRLPPWLMVGEADDQIQVIWSEFQKIRKKRSSTEEEDLAGYVCEVLGRDISEDRWRDCQVEKSDAVLDIERLIFKDLIGETICHLAALNRSDSLRRRLLF
ncbi:Protein LONGIFOLIA 1 [Cardamine amara subsp. amara]|uniref:Protein LONGIFOLIA 1 n=1 Tax=Cardamine amara subsp. amara TaxID=228776 RepID=A0ABD0ZUM5_CARAN